MLGAVVSLPVFIVLLGFVGEQARGEVECACSGSKTAPTKFGD